MKAPKHTDLPDGLVEEMWRSGECVMNDINNYELKDGGKRLTSFLGECFHDPLWHDMGGSFCSKCDTALNGIFDMHRTFTTPDDRQALCEKLMDRKEWIPFENYCLDVWDSRSGPFQSFAYWLLVEQPARFCWLVDQWLKDKEDKP